MKKHKLVYYTSHEIFRKISEFPVGKVSEQLWDKIETRLYAWNHLDRDASGFGFIDLMIKRNANEET